MIGFILANKKISLFILALIILFPIGFYQLTFRVQKHKDLNTTVNQTYKNPAMSAPTQEIKPTSFENDALVKSKILTLIPQGESGYVYQDANINIEYIKSADSFQVEILEENVDAAKDEAVQWFLQRGLSKQGVCTLPINFYLNYDLSTKLKDKNAAFNPLPPGC